MRRIASALAAVVLAVLGAAAPARAPAAATRIDYTDPANWLCLPGRSDSCAATLSATVISADGTMSRRSLQTDPNAPVDCFYVYPTVSTEPGANADMTAGAEEQRTALLQLAPFGAKCKLYAPLYRQFTLAALRGEVHGIDVEMPYQDVLDAWNVYLTRYNHGRGVVLIGHSQGSHILARLIATQIDGTALERQLVTAILPGTDVEVPRGRDVGGTFRHVPLCHGARQAGCAIAYSTYLASAPPEADAFFGAPSVAGDVDACVNPAALDGKSSLDADLPPVGIVARTFDTTFIENPNQLSAACASNAGHAYLAIAVSPAAPLLATALKALQGRHPGWGLHAFDINLTEGNLVDLVGSESSGWLAAHPQLAGR
jgi:hypothetical protein